MKIAISSTGESIDSPVDPRFGRCAYFIMVEQETGKPDVIRNPAASLGGGAGIQAAQTVVDRGVQVVITGDVGPNAYRVLAGAGVQVITGVSGTCAEALEKYKSGTLRSVSAPTVPGHHGGGQGRRGRAW